MNPRVVYGLGSILLLTGAFAVGGVLHRVFVVGTLALTSPVAVLGLLVGVVLITVGYRLEERHRDALDPEENEANDEFDEEYAPLDESDMEGYERDDEY